MNTKTMRLPPRRVISGGKQTETAMINPPPPRIKSILKKTSPPVKSGAAVSAVVERAGSNQLLAGYLAHEFLNKGTIFGEEWNLPTRAQAGPFTAQLNESRKTKLSYDIEPSENKRRRYVEVANILRVDGTHLPGVFNPSQLAGWLKL